MEKEQLLEFIIFIMIIKMGQTIKILEDYLESKLELSDEMKKRLKEIQNMKKEDMLSTNEALYYLRKIKRK